jgi:hypothetical protein
VTYLPELQRILVEGAMRLEHQQLDGTAEALTPARLRRGARLVAALRRLSRKRFFILIGVGLLAGGTAAAAIIALHGRRSAAPAGALHSQAGFGSDLEVTSGRYSVSVTPALRGGTVGLCVSEQDNESALVPIGDARALRGALTERRTQIEARLRAGGLGVSSRGSLTHAVDVVIPQLLADLRRPVGIRDSRAFLAAYSGLFGSSGGGASGCGVAAQAGDPIVGSFGQTDKSGGGQSRPITTSTLVVITTPAVAAVRVSPALTVLTSRDRELPDGYRIAIAVAQSVGSSTGLALGAGAPPLVPLGRAGQPLSVVARPALVGDHAVFWTPSGRHEPPAGACEIATGSLTGVHLAFGAVVRRIQSFPQLTQKSYLSCASISFRYAGRQFTAAIVLDAQHPGTLPASLPLSTPAAGQPGVVTERTTPVGGGESIAARRIGDAWLIVEGSGPPATRLTVLHHLTVCVRVTGVCR